MVNQYGEYNVPVKKVIRPNGEPAYLAKNHFTDGVDIVFSKKVNVCGSELPVGSSMIDVIDHITGGGGGSSDIKSISVNGTKVTPDAQKNVNIPVPTKTSDLENDSGFITEHQDISKKRDKNDRSVYKKVNELWRWSSTDPNLPEDFLELANAINAPVPKYHVDSGGEGNWANVVFFNTDGTVRYICVISHSAEYTGQETELNFIISNEAEEKFFRVTAKRDSATDETMLEMADEIAHKSDLFNVGKKLADIRTLMPMKEAWLNASSAAEAADMMIADPSVHAGDGYLGTVNWLDLQPMGMACAEVKAFVISNDIVQFEMTSSDTPPFAWFFNSWGGTWRTYLPITDHLDSEADYEALSARQGKILKDMIVEKTEGLRIQELELTLADGSTKKFKVLCEEVK